MGAGELDPLVLRDRKPVWKRSDIWWSSDDGCGGKGMGEDETSSGLDSRSCMEIGGTSIVEASGVESNACGVFSYSARAPSSVSSRHLTARLTGDLRFGVNEMPFFTEPSLRRRGDVFTGDELSRLTSGSRGRKLRLHRRWSH